MTGEPTQRHGERVLVALGADPDCLDLLEHAADLARAIDAELAGLFVEDENLLRLSQLPGSEIVFATGSSRRTSMADMERQLKSRASEAQKRLEQVAARRKIAWSFEVRRCGWSEAMSDAARSARVVATGRSGRTPIRGYGLAPTRDRAQQAHGSRGGLAVLYEDGKAAGEVLALGARAAAALSLPLTVLIPARTTAVAEKRATSVRQQCGALRPPPQIVRLPATRSALLRRLKEQRPQILLLDAEGTLAGSGQLREMVDTADCRVMLVSHD